MAVGRTLPIQHNEGIIQRQKLYGETCPSREKGRLFPASQIDKSNQTASETCILRDEETKVKYVNGIWIQGELC